MGIFSMIKALLQMKRAGGNFGYIAQNMGTIYYALKQTSFGQNLTDDQLLYGTALSDLFSYLQAGHLVYEDVRRIVETGKRGYVGLSPYAVTHDLDAPHDEWTDLVNVTMQLENVCFMLAGATDRDRVAIVQQILQNRQTIRDELIRSVQLGKSGPLYNAVNGHITAWAQDPDFQEEILEFSLD